MNFVWRYHACTARFLHNLPIATKTPVIIVPTWPLGLSVSIQKVSCQRKIYFSCYEDTAVPRDSNPQNIHLNSGLTNMSKHWIFNTTESWSMLVKRNGADMAPQWDLGFAKELHICSWYSIYQYVTRFQSWNLYRAIVKMCGFGLWSCLDGRYKPDVEIW